MMIQWKARVFIKKAVWDDIGGFDLSLGAGGDDIDLTQKLFEKNMLLKEQKISFLHNEGNLTLKNTIRKHFMYGREMFNYLKKDLNHGSLHITQ